MGVDMDMGLSGHGIRENAAGKGTAGGRKGSGPRTIVDVRSELQQAITGGMDGENGDWHEERFLKPIAGFGYNKEMRELAQVVSRDIFTSNPNVR